MMDNLGAILGPLLALILVATVGTRAAILISVIPGLLAAMAIVYAIRVARQHRKQERRPIRIQIRPVLSGQLGRLFFGVSAFEVGNVAATLLILRATEILRPHHGQDSATSTALGLYLFYNLIATVASLGGGRLVDRRGALVVLTAGVACFGLAYGGFAFTDANIGMLAVCFGLAGLAIGFVETAENAAVAVLAPAEIRGSAFGAMATVQSLGNFAASSTAGLIWTVVSPQAAFLYLAGWMIIALLALIATGLSARAASST
jgi:MFS family permease